VRRHQGESRWSDVTYERSDKMSRDERSELAVVKGPGLPRNVLVGLATLLLTLGVMGAASSAPGQPLNTAPPPSGPPTTGYWEVALDGGVFAFGNASYYGSMVGQSLNGAIRGIVATPDGKGYWLFASDGGVFAFGDAPFLGSPAVPSNARTPSMTLVGMATTPDGKGYWLVNASGDVYTFGDAKYLGGTGGTTLNKWIVGMAATPDGNGYRLVASDGSVFAFGDAAFYGSMGGHPLSQSIVGIVTDTSTGGYWLVAYDGGVFDFNGGYFCGSPGGQGYAGVVGMALNAPNQGYWLAGSDGAIFLVAAYCNTPYYGSLLGKPLNAPVVGIAQS
jgi:hypothetical protein